MEKEYKKINLKELLSEIGDKKASLAFKTGSDYELTNERINELEKILSDHIERTENRLEKLEGVVFKNNSVRKNEDIQVEAKNKESSLAIFKTPIAKEITKKYPIKSSFKKEVEKENELELLGVTKLAIEIRKRKDRVLHPSLFILEILFWSFMIIGDHISFSFSMVFLLGVKVVIGLLGFSLIRSFFMNEFEEKVKFNNLISKVEIKKFNQLFNLETINNNEVKNIFEIIEVMPNETIRNLEKEIEKLESKKVSSEPKLRVVHE